MIQSQIAELVTLATGREKSLFFDDVQQCHVRLWEQIADRRILLIGGAGSIGAATLRTLIQFRPAAMHVVDQNENGLAELVRDLRSCFEPDELHGLRTFPLNFGSPVMERLIREQPSYDHVLNFAALKHVRSEKDCYSLLQMLDTNVLKPARLLRWLVDRGGVRSYFCVSTDKAANPVSLMGASKRLMEHVSFSTELIPNSTFRCASARFANVAFSDGSLPQSWLLRLSKGQPLAVPRATRRYFVSLEEAGQICLLAGFLAPDRHLLVPRLHPGKDLLDLSELAMGVLQHLGYEPELLDDEREAKKAARERKSQKSYPLLLTARDTSGEKPYEEFVGAGEQTIELSYQYLMGVPYLPCPCGTLAVFMESLEGMIGSPEKLTTKEKLIREIQTVLPELRHLSGSKILDQRI